MPLTTNTSSKKNNGQEYLTDNLDNICTAQINHIKIINIDIPILCPVCKAEMKIRDTKRRYIKSGSGERYPFRLRRYYCPNCRRLHTELPDVVKPYQQYDVATVERVQSGDSFDFCGDNSTIRKWRGQK